jgi:hypothetical protein
MMKPRGAMGGESSTHGAVTDMYKILVGKSEWKRPHEKLRKWGVSERLYDSDWLRDWQLFKRQFDIHRRN